MNNKNNVSKIETGYIVTTALFLKVCSCCCLQWSTFY